MSISTEPNSRAPLGKTRPVLAAFTDFREYLKEFYEFKRWETRRELRPYSYAHFSAAADIKSPNYLKLIIEGQRNLSQAMVRKFSKALGLNKAESEEFMALVKYGQAKDPLERNQHLKELAEARVQKQIKSGEINSKTWDKVSSWVTWVLYALADQKGVVFDPKELHRLMKENASIAEIEKALGGLLEAGELVKDQNTLEVKKGRKLMSGSESVPAELVRKLQAELIYLGLESLFQEDPRDREFGAFTMALTEDEFEHLKFELRQLRKRLYADFMIAREKDKGDRVFQLNFQLFPVTKNPKDL